MLGSYYPSAMIFDLPHRLCVPNKTKNVDVKLFNVITETNESKWMVLIIDGYCR